MKRKIGIWLLSIIVISFLFTNGWIIWKKGQFNTHTIVTEYQSTLKQDVKKTLSTKGVVIPSDTYEVIFQEEKGDTYTVLVQEGEYVNKGEPIIQYENQVIDAEIEALENKQMEFVNIMDELSSEITSLESESIEVMALDEESKETMILESIQNQSELSNKKSELRLLSLQLEDVKEEIQKLKRLKEQLIVDSQLDGIVTDIQEGTYKEGEKILTIKSNEPLLVKGKISEYQMQSVSPNLSAVLKIEALNNQKFEGVVTKIGRTPLQKPTIENEESEYPVFIQINEVNESIVEGFHTTIDIILEKRTDVLTLPIHSVVKKDKQTYAYVLEDGKLNKRLIMLGLQEDNYIEVKKGIKQGEHVVFQPRTNMKDGQTFFIPIEFDKLEKKSLKQFNREQIFRILIKSMLS